MTLPPTNMVRNLIIGCLACYRDTREYPTHFILTPEAICELKLRRDILGYLTFDAEAEKFCGVPIVARRGGAPAAYRTVRGDEVIIKLTGYGDQVKGS